MRLSVDALMKRWDRKRKDRDWEYDVNSYDRAKRMRDICKRNNLDSQHYHQSRMNALQAKWPNHKLGDD
jgi:hypothetical protein